MRWRDFPRASLSSVNEGNGSQPGKRQTMKKSPMLSPMLLAAIVVLVITTRAAAQSVHMKADIPFNFIVSGATLPAGEYSLASVDVDGRVLLIRDLTAHRNNLIVANSCRSNNGATKSKLIFHRYGGRNFLRQIWVQGSYSGHELPTSRREREVAKTFSMQEVVLVAAQR